MRSIKQLIRGLSDSPVIKEDWDITPVTETITPDLVITQTHNCVNNSGQIVADVTGITDGQYLSAVKTNLTMQALENNKTIKFGFTANDIPTLSPCLIGIYLAPSSHTAVQVTNEVYGILFQGLPLANNRILHYSLFFGSTYQAPTKWRIPNTATPNGVTGNLVNSVAKADLATGSQSGMLLSRRNNNLYIGRFDNHSDGVQYDLNGREAIVNGPVIADTMTVFFVTLVADQGSGLENIAYTPSVTLVPTGYDTAGTSVSRLTPPNNVDWANFAAPARPSYSTTRQASLPSNVRIGQFYRVTIDPSYTGADPTPYGYPLKNNQTVLINSVTGNGAITAYVDNETLVTMVNDITQPMADQQVTMLQSISDIGALVAQTQSEVNVALLNTEELVVYVKVGNGLLGAGKEDLEFSSAVVFESFDAAYEYSITLPKFLKKRIVFDDRTASVTDIDSVAGKTYYLLENSITLSNYTKFTNLDIRPVTNYPSVNLTFNSTGIKVDKFKGTYLVEDTKIPCSISEATLPITFGTISSINVGDDCELTITDNTVDFSIAENIIKIGERSLLNVFLFSGILANNYQPFRFYRGKDSSVNLSQNSLYVKHPLFTNFVRINRPHDNSQDTIQLDEMDVRNEWTDIDPLTDNNNARIIRSLVDLGQRDGFGNFQLLTGKYLFAKSLDLRNSSLVIEYGQVVELEALPSVIISNTVDKPVLVNKGVCYDDAVTFKLNTYTLNIPIIQNTHRYYRNGGKLIGNKLFTTNRSIGGYYHEFVMTNVEHFADPSVGINNYFPEVGECDNFVFSNIKLNTVLGNIPVIQLNIAQLNIIQRYFISNVVARYNSIPSFGIVNITGSFTKTDGRITDAISIKNNSIYHDNSAGSNVLQLVTKDGLPYGVFDLAFDYDDKRMFLNITNGTGNAASNSSVTNAVAISSSFYTLIGGISNDIAAPGHYRIRSKKSTRNFIATLEADVYKTTATTGDAMVGVYTANLSTGQRGFESTYTFPLSAANVRKSIKITVNLGAIPFDRTVFVGGCLSNNNGNSLFFENVNFTIQEV